MITFALADSEMTFYLSKSHTEENTSISTTEQSEPVQTPTDSSAGAKYHLIVFWIDVFVCIIVFPVFSFIQFTSYQWLIMF